MNSFIVGKSLSSSAIGSRVSDSAWLVCSGVTPSDLEGSPVEPRSLASTIVGGVPSAPFFLS